MNNDNHYPYRHAEEFIREIPDKFGKSGFEVKLDRMEASQIIKAVADAIGMSHEELASKLADAYLKGE